MKLADDARRAGYRLNSFERLASTNDEALERAASGDRGALWVVAGAQSAGRGRQGRAWTSPPGNLYASLLLVDAVEPAAAWQLGFVAGVALADAVAAVLGPAHPVAIKWPNDLLADGAKLAGILVEGTRLASGSFAAVLGFGVNCASHPQATSYPATHLQALATRGTRDAVFAALSAAVLPCLSTWDRGRGFERVRALWLERALAPGTPIAVNAYGARRNGSFRSIDPRGRLVLETVDGLLHVEVGDVLPAQGPTLAPHGVTSNDD